VLSKTSMDSSIDVNFSRFTCNVSFINLFLLV
jgi:hypothetical protein